MENTMSTTTITNTVSTVSTTNSGTSIAPAVHVKEPARVIELPRLRGTTERGGVAACSSAPTSTIDAFPGTHAWGPPT